MHEKDIGNPHFCIQMDTKTQIDLKFKNIKCKKSVLKRKSKKSKKTMRKRT